MEANKDAALACLKKAKVALNAHNLEEARRLANKSKKLYPTQECESENTFDFKVL